QVNPGTTDYTLTNAYAKIDFGTTDLEVSLPAGTYFIEANVGFRRTTADVDEIFFKLRDTTNSADLVGSERHIRGQSEFTAVNFSAVVTLAGTTTIQAWAYNA